VIRSALCSWMPSSERDSARRYRRRLNTCQVGIKERDTRTVTVSADMTKIPVGGFFGLEPLCNAYRFWPRIARPLRLLCHDRAFPIRRIFRKAPSPYLATTRTSIVETNFGNAASEIVLGEFDPNTLSVDVEALSSGTARDCRSCGGKVIADQPFKAPYQSDLARNNGGNRGVSRPENAYNHRIPIFSEQRSNLTSRSHLAFPHLRGTKFSCSFPS
jgi:hypothetical protein